MKILSIQSSVAYGHVGNSAAVFPLQRLGHEVWPVHTVHFSNHTGYGAWRGPLLAADDVREVITGIEERGVLGQVDAVLSGYQGGEDIGEVILDAVARVKKANPAATYTCDPVMGNARSGCFVHPAIPVLLRERVVPAGRPDHAQPVRARLPHRHRARRTWRAPSPRSTWPGRWVRRPFWSPASSDPRLLPETIEMLAVDRRRRVAGPDAAPAAEGQRIGRRDRSTLHRPLPQHRRRRRRAGPHGVQRLRPAAHDAESGERELQLVESQDFYAHPRMQFEVTRVR